MIQAVIDSSVSAIQEVLEERGAALFSAVEGLEEQKGIIPLKLTWDLSGDPHHIEVDLKHVTKKAIIGTALRDIDLAQGKLGTIEEEAKGKKKKAAPDPDDEDGDDGDDAGGDGDEEDGDDEDEAA